MEDFGQEVQFNEEEYQKALQELEQFQNQNYDFTTQTDVSPVFSLGWFLVWLAVVVVLIVSMWKLFEKAKQPGWASLIPIYNTYVMLKIAGLPWWWLLLFFIPFVNIVFAIIATVYFVKSYGKGTGFIVASIFFPFVTYPMMAFGQDEYKGPAYKG